MPCDQYLPEDKRQEAAKHYPDEIVNGPYWAPVEIMDVVDDEDVIVQTWMTDKG